METRYTKGIIIDRRDFREYDSLVTVYTPDYGKIDLVARGTKKPSSKIIGHIEPVSCSELMIIFGKKIDYIGSAVNINAFAGIKSDYYDTVLVGRALAFFSRLVKNGEGDESLYDLLNNFLDILNSGHTADPRLLYRFFALKLLSYLGYRPELFSCAVCGKKLEAKGNYFSVSDGGIVCSDCVPRKENTFSFSGDAIKVLRFVLDNTLIEAQKITCHKNIRREVVDCIDHLMRFY